MKYKEKPAQGEELDRFYREIENYNLAFYALVGQENNVRIFEGTWTSPTSPRNIGADKIIPLP